MTRFDRFSDFMHQYAYQSYYPNNVFAISENLERADQDNCLYQFFINQSPYRSAFPLMTSDGGARGKDQVAIVFALNIYGGDHPGFVHRLNRVLNQLAAGSGKEQEAVMVLMRAQTDYTDSEAADSYSLSAYYQTGKKACELEAPSIYEAYRLAMELKRRVPHLTYRCSIN